MYRVTRTILTGQYANDKCFTDWLEKQTAAKLVTMRIDPLNTGGSNDHRYYLWEQTAQVVTPKCPNSDPDLITHNGANGWQTQAEAQAVLDYELGQSKVLADNIAEKNAAAVAPGKLLGEAAKELAADAGKVAKGLGPWPWIGVGIGGAVLVYLVLKR